MPVKSILVPDVLFCAVINVFNDIVPVPAWTDTVFVPEMDGTDIVTVPDVSPDKTSELIYFPIKQPSVSRSAQ
jgi:hypothetical protein